MKIVLGAGLIVTIFSVFYWFEIRPSHIRSICEKEAIDKVKKIGNATTDTYELSYKMCIREKGLKE